jgi:hypothetical protein
VVCRRKRSHLPSKYSSCPVPQEVHRRDPEKTGGTLIKLRGEHKCHHLVAIGYKYNKKCVLHFIMSESAAGSTEDRKPYQMKFLDAFGNVHVCSEPFPEVISDFLMIAIVLIFTVNFDNLQSN